MLAIVSLIGGLVLLLAGGHYLVAGGVSLSRHFNISTLVVGVTVIAFGTSAPELIVGIKSNLLNHPDITLGNVIGSNIANIGLVLALSAAVLPVVIREGALTRDWLIMLGSYMVFALCMYDGQIVRWEGILMFALLALFIYTSISRSRTDESDDIPETPQYSLWLAFVIVAGAVAALSYGADLLVDGAATLARMYGVSERVISVSLIAVGTSVPELATSLIAAFKKEMDISVGNIIGSNIFNIFAVLGLSSIIAPIHIDGFWSYYMIDLAAMITFSVLLFLAILPMSRGIIDRWKGALMLACYIGYIYFIF